MIGDVSGVPLARGHYYTEDALYKRMITAKLKKQEQNKE
jgi:hypothetical protein